MTEIFRAILYQPIFNIFVALYNIIPDAGVVILIVTIIIKGGLYPLTGKSIKAQKSMTDLQPKLEEVKAKYKDDKQKIAQETMKLYKEHKVNPFGSCLPLLIQLPVFIALYWVLRGVLNSDSFDLLYPFVKSPGSINSVTLGFLDLKNPNIILAVLAGGAQFVQAKMLSTKKPPKEAKEGGKDEGMASMMNKQMLYMMPVMTLLIGMKLPGGLTLYWFLSTLLTAGQQWILFKKKDDPSDSPPNGDSTKPGKKDDVVEGEIVE